MLRLLTLCQCWMFLTLNVQAAEKIPVDFRGNVLLIDEVYRSIIDMPPGAKVDEPTGQVLVRQVTTFLRRSGFELARVKARVEGEKIVVEVDEGQLQKVIFFGGGSLRTLRLKLELQLPHNVFNRPYLERQLKNLAQKHGLQNVTYKLVAPPKVEHSGPQLDDLVDSDVLKQLPPPGKYELCIYLGNVDWDTGISLDLVYDFPDGLELDIDYRGENALFEADRWVVGAVAGGALRNSLHNDATYPALTRTLLDLRYFTPALFGVKFRPFLWFQSDLVSRQRSDLELETYYSEHLGASLNFGYEFTRGLFAFVGGGVQGHFFFGIDQYAQTVDLVDVLPVRAPNQLRFFALARLEWIFNRGEARRDMRHQLMVELRPTWPDRARPFGQVSLDYRNTFPMGWNEFRLRIHGAWLWGEILFDDEEPVGGRYVRGVFGGRYWVHQAAALGLEFRFSLMKDIFKIGVFHDLVVFGELGAGDPGRLDRPVNGIQVANSFGPGFHALILNLFQLDIFYSFGFNLSGDFEKGLALGLTKVF